MAQFIIGFYVNQRQAFDMKLVLKGEKRSRHQENTKNLQIELENIFFSSIGMHIPIENWCSIFKILIIKKHFDHLWHQKVDVIM